MKDEEKIVKALQSQINPAVKQMVNDHPTMQDLPTNKRLISLIRYELSDAPSSMSIFENFLQDMTSWRWAMLDVVQSHHLHKKQRILNEATSLLRFAEDLHPINELNRKSSA